MEKTTIEWVRNSDGTPGYTFNPWLGCTHVSPGCNHCYAETLMDQRFGKVAWGKGKSRVRTSVDTWRKPVRWNTQAAAAGMRIRVFCASLADVFDPEVETEWRRDVFSLIGATPQLDWLILTKRPHLIPSMVPMRDGAGRNWMRDGFPANIWIGTSVEDQRRADERIPHIMRVPAAIRFLSCEPLLGPLDLMHIPGGDDDDLDVLRGTYGRTNTTRTPLCFGMSHLHAVDWVIVGGESGAAVRPMHPDWARSIRDQCVDARIPFFFKQWGQWHPDCMCATKRPCHTVERPQPGGAGVMFRCGKHAGRVLDGRMWNAMPCVQ